MSTDPGEIQLRSNSFANHVADIRAALAAGVPFYKPLDIGLYEEYHLKLTEAQVREMIDAYEEWHIFYDEEAYRAIETRSPDDHESLICFKNGYSDRLFFAYNN